MPAPGVADEDLDIRFWSIVTDAVGTPTELLAQSGEIDWHHRATLWGSSLPGFTDQHRCPLRFPGQYADAETGLHYNNQRYYDPETARYLSPDPLGLAPAPNQHGYVLNPLAWIDPLGLESCETGIDNATYDALDAKYGTRVAEGVDHDFVRMNDGSATAADHSIATIGKDHEALAEYLKQHEGKMTHTDTDTGSSVAYDESVKDSQGRGVLIVQTAYRIHAYHYDADKFNPGRYTTQ